MTGTPLREFSRPPPVVHHDNRTRLAAGLLTGLLYAVLALVGWWDFDRAPRPARTREITAMLLPRTPPKRIAPPVLSHLLKPHADKPAVPVFTITPDAPSEARLTPSAAQTSPLSGGAAGNGAGQGAAGTGGNGGAAGGCLDAAWMRAVSERVRQFFTYPPAALAVRRTGLVMVHFEVRRSGQIEKLAIAKSSGDAGLDKAAMEIVQKAQPLPPIPDRMQTDRVEGELPVNFGVRSFNGSSTTGTCGG